MSQSEYVPAKQRRSQKKHGPPDYFLDFLKKFWRDDGKSCII